MRARDLFEEKEADVPDGARDTMLPSMVVHNLDNAYGFYRALIAIAGLPDTDAALASVTPDSPYFAPYTKTEMEHVKKVLKKMGATPTHLSNKPSQEPATTNKVSPVRQFKDIE
jgi:hypothetical protein